MSRISRSASTASLAAAAAFLMIAFQTAGKVARDAFFLSNFPVSKLPAMIAVAGVVSLVVVVVASWSMGRISTSRFVPLAFLTSGLLVLGESVLQYRQPQTAAVLVYLHIAVFGPVLASGFWALVGDVFDPRGARKNIAGIGVGGTAGGLAGGFVTGSLGLAGTLAPVLPFLGILHLGCAGLALSVGRSARRSGLTGQSREIGIGSVFETIRWTRHLQSLAGLVLLSAASTVFLDYVFKAEAGRRYPDANELLAFFACFYTAAAFLTFLFQITIANLSIERLGLGKTAGSLPLTVASGQLLLIWLPGLFVGAMARGGEIVLRSSLFRSAYELFFTPLREKDRRRTKLLIDVGAERLGDAAGGSLLVLLLGLPISSSRTIVLLTGAMIALGAGYLALRLQRSYVSTLAARVMSGAVRIPESEQPAATRLTLFQSLLEIPTSLPADLRDSAPYEARARRSGKSLETLEGLLESGDEEQVTRALRRPDVVAPSHTAALIRLLAWDAVAPLAGSVLIRIGPPACSQLAACLADTSEDFVIRRRIPGLLAHDACQSNADALLSGARDPRFEVRYRVAVALCRIRKKNAAVHLDRDELIRWILRELGVDRLVWHSRRPLEEDQEEDFEEAETDSRRPGASRSLRHVFNLLTLLLPEDKLTAALTAVRCGDVRLRGTALEYLESILPEEIWEKLAPWLGEEEAAGTTDR